MELRAAVLLNDEEFKANDIRKHITRFSKKDKQRVNDSFDELVAILESGEDIPPSFKPHKVNATQWEVHLVSRGSDVLVKFEWFTRDGVSYIRFIKCTDHARLNAQLLALAESDLLLDPEEVAQIEAMYKRLYG